MSDKQQRLDLRCPRCGVTLRQAQAGSTFTVSIKGIWAALFKASPVDPYVCTSCGHMELIVRDVEKLRF